MTNITDSSSYIDDQPSEKKDLLGFRPYVRALHNSIVSDATKTPLVVGIYGLWGSGKTTLMKFLEEMLKESGLKTVWFNAWQYSKEEELWAAFLQSTINKINNQVTYPYRLVFAVKMLYQRINWDALPETLISIFARLTVTLLPLFVSSVLSIFTNSNSSVLIERLGQVITLILGVWLIIRPSINSIKDAVTLDLSRLKKDSSYKEHIAFLDKFKLHFEDLVSCLPGRNDKKLVIFIDDLDRCSSDGAIQVLDAIKLFVDIKGCVYVLGLDVEVITKLLKLKYPDDLEAQQNYLGKIIQIPFEPPPFSLYAIRTFVTNLPVTLPDNRSREVFAAGLPRNPRSIKRAVNLFSLQWNIARERSNLNISPVKLSKIVSIQCGHPELYKLIQKNPDYLVELEKYFNNRLTVAQAKAQMKVASPSPSNSQRNMLVKILNDMFNFDDIRNLCFDLAVDYENLEGDSKAAKIRSLILHLERRGRIDSLVDLIKKERPTIENSLLDDLNSSETNLQEETLTSQQYLQVSSAIEPFTNNDQLRRMLLLYKEAPGCCFDTGDAGDVEVYLTLSSQTEEPIFKVG